MEEGKRNLEDSHFGSESFKDEVEESEPNKKLLEYLSKSEMK